MMSGDQVVIRYWTWNRQLGWRWVCSVPMRYARAKSIIHRYSGWVDKNLGGYPVIIKCKEGCGCG